MSKGRRHGHFAAVPPRFSAGILTDFKEKPDRMSPAEAGQLEERLEALPAVREVKVHDRACDVALRYEGGRQTALQDLGAAGILPPATSALLHNPSTLASACAV